MKQKLIKFFKNSFSSWDRNNTAIESIEKINFEKFELMALFAWRVTFINHAD